MFVFSLLSCLAIADASTDIVTVFDNDTNLINFTMEPTTQGYVYEPVRGAGQSGKIITVSVVREAPWFKYINAKYIGFGVDILEHLSYAMNCKYQIVREQEVVGRLVDPVRNKYDRSYEDVASGIADIAVGPFIYDTYKDKFAYSTPYMDASLTALIPNNLTKINTLLDIAMARDGFIKFGLLEGSETYNYFNLSRVLLHKSMFLKVMANRFDRLFFRNTDALNRIMNIPNFAYLTDKLTADYIQKENCNKPLKQIETFMTLGGYSIVSQNFKLITAINIALKRIKDRDVIKNLQDIWWQPRHCENLSFPI